MQDTLSIYTHVLGLVQPTTDKTPAAKNPIHDANSPINWGNKGGKVYLNGRGGGITLTDVLKKAATDTNSPDDLQLQNLIFDWVKTDDESETTQFHPLNAVAVLDSGNPKRPKVSISGSTAIWDLWQNHVCGMYSPDERDKLLNSIQEQFASTSSEAKRLIELWKTVQPKAEPLVAAALSKIGTTHEDPGKVLQGISDKIKAITGDNTKIEHEINNVHPPEIEKLKQEYDITNLQTQHNTLTAKFADNIRNIKQVYDELKAQVNYVYYPASSSNERLNTQATIDSLKPDINTLS